jgi:hypothetical protein
MAQQAAIAIGEQGRPPTTVLTNPAMANRIHVAMQCVEPSNGQSQLDRLVPKSKRQKLPASHDPVLLSRQPSQLSLPFPLPVRACLSFRGHIHP